MVFISNVAKQKVWDERITAFLASGQSGRAWCQEHGLSQQQLSYWLNKSRSESRETPNDRWIKMEATALSGTGVSLRLGDVVLEIERGFDKVVLADVVRALMTVC